MAGLLLPAAMLSACDVSLGDERRPLSVTSNSTTRPQTPVKAVAATPTVPTVVEERSDGGDADAEDEVGASPYELMCRNYCQDLEDTGFYFCLGTGQGPASCAETVRGWATRCYELRCVPMLVQPSLCFSQCDSLATTYGPVCADAAGDAGTSPFCRSSPAEHDRGCRAGCAAPSAPPP